MAVADKSTVSRGLDSCCTHREERSRGNLPKDIYHFILLIKRRYHCAIRLEIRV